MHFIVTGGTGYLGGIMALHLHDLGHRVSIIDNFSNSTPFALERLKEATGDTCGARLFFKECDVCHRQELISAFTSFNNDEKVDGVFHFAGLKSVNESIEYPDRYRHNNVLGTLNVTDALMAIECDKLIFSSSATVYKEKTTGPLNEEDPVGPINVYGETKLASEYHLEELCSRNKELSVAILRYFNPVGADSTGFYGECPNGVPNNLMPYVFDVAIGKREKVSVFGDNYNTKDGTGIRDYIHVEDLASGHLLAFYYLKKNKGAHTFNLGTEQGYSVLDMINAVKEETGKPVPFVISERRNGDLGCVTASTDKANKLLSWKPKKTLKDMIASQWLWHQHLHETKGEH